MQNATQNRVKIIQYNYTKNNFIVNNFIFQKIANNSESKAFFAKFHLFKKKLEIKILIRNYRKKFSSTKLLFDFPEVS